MVYLNMLQPLRAFCGRNVQIHLKMPLLGESNADVLNMELRQSRYSDEKENNSNDKKNKQ